MTSVILRIVLDVLLLIAGIFYTRLGFKGGDKWQTVVWDLFFIFMMIAVWFI